MCYQKRKEVIAMEEKENSGETPREEAYVPRPRWQVWAARIGLAALLVFLALYYLNIARGGI